MKLSIVPIAEEHIETFHAALGIIADYRGTGIGTALMRAAIDASRAFGLTRVELTVREGNTNAIALYMKMGFEVEGLKRNAVRVDGNYENYISVGLLLDEQPSS